MSRYTLTLRQTQLIRTTGASLPTDQRDDFLLAVTSSLGRTPGRGGFVGDAVVVKAIDTAFDHLAAA
jgi:hypothetical protein